MKRLRLKKWVKVVMSSLLIIIICMMSVSFGINRINKINNNEIVVVSQSEMAERN